MLYKFYRIAKYSLRNKKSVNKHLLVRIAICSILSQFIIIDDLPANEIDSTYSDIIILPFVKFAPETDLEAGVGTYIVRHDTNNLVIYPYPDELEFYASYTQRGQFQTMIEPIIYFAGGYRYASRLSYKFFPDLFYGIGRDAKLEGETPYNNELVIFRNVIERVVYRNYGKAIYLGGVFQLEWFENDIQSQYQSVFDTIPSSNRNNVMSFGLASVADFRNNVFAADSGQYLSWEILYNNDLNSDNFSYLSLKSDYRYFLELIPSENGQGHILAFQNTLGLSSSAPPFNKMNLIGNDMIMRGYYEGRYRDLNSIALQSEYRFPLFWRFRGAVFGSIGNVSDDILGLVTNRWLYAYGIGGRFIWDRTSKLSGRLDLGFTPEGVSLYIGIKEAF